MRLRVTAPPASQGFAEFTITPRGVQFSFFLSSPSLQFWRMPLKSSYCSIKVLFFFLVNISVLKFLPNVFGSGDTSCIQMPKGCSQEAGGGAPSPTAWPPARVRLRFRLTWLLAPVTGRTRERIRERPGSSCPWKGRSQPSTPFPCSDTKAESRASSSTHSHLDKGELGFRAQAPHPRWAEMPLDPASLTEPYGEVLGWTSSSATFGFPFPPAGVQVPREPRKPQTEAIM